MLPIALGLALAAAALPLPGMDPPFPTGPSAPALSGGAAGGDTSGPIEAPDHGVAGATSPPERTFGGPLRSGVVGTPPAAVATGIEPGTADRASVDMSTTYDVKLNLNFGTRAITVETVLAATNTSGGPVDRLELNTIATRLGGMRLTHASVEGADVAVAVDDQTIVVPLGGVLADGATVNARVVYKATLRSTLSGSSWLFTRTNGIANLYRWLPWVSRATPFTRPNHGDPFVTASSPRVTVAVTTDRPLVLAATGDRIAASGLTQTFEARDVRDFTITAAPDFKKGSRTVGDTTIRLYYRPGFPATATLDIAARALARMNKLVGTYPYRTYRIVQSAGGYGMESPGLTWIPSGVGSSNLRYLINHETAHQWFYGLVGSDQARQPFADEAAADFLARYALGQKRSSRCANTRLDRNIYHLSSSCYYEVVYIQGGNFIDDLRHRMGSTAFWKGLRAYVAANRHGLVATRTLLDTLDAHTPLDLVPRFEARFPKFY